MANTPPRSFSPCIPTTNRLLLQQGQTASPPPPTSLTPPCTPIIAMPSPFLLLLLSLLPPASGFNSMGPISAASGGVGTSPFFCAIDARGRQDVVCWGKNGATLLTGTFASLPPMAALSGGEGFMCGLLSNTSRVYCWDSNGSGTELAPIPSSASIIDSYSLIAAGSTHVCAIRGSYYSDGGTDSGSVDCWDIYHDGTFVNTLKSTHSTSFSDEGIRSRLFKRVVSGEGFSCGVITHGGLLCWGPNSHILGVSKVSENFTGLAAGRTSVCGISEDSGQVRCWGIGGSGSQAYPSVGIRFVSLAAGEHHYCGIREDTHGVECWDSLNSSSVPKGYGFYAIASSDFAACGIRDTDLVLDCWPASEYHAPPDYDPPLELCSPGLCSWRPCNVGEFAFNASSLEEPALSSLCVRKGLSMCVPCGFSCSDGFFLSSPCTESADRVCTPCSLCQNSSCWGVCGLPTLEEDKGHEHGMQRMELIIGPCVLGFLLTLIGWCLFPHLFFFRSKGGGGGGGPAKHFGSCVGKRGPDGDSDDGRLRISPAPCPGEAQIFRLSDLKGATNGFKEFHELGRGSYGFVYKATLADGLQVAVKRANAATILRTNIRDFEVELEVLCKLRHCSIVNLLGYCLEMGERLLVYEYMPRGTLHDHLHGGLSPLNWNLRMKIAIQAAKGLEYLHKDAVPQPLVHRNLKTSNILLDSEWGARVSNLGFCNLSGNGLNKEMKSDVYNFGIVLLEIFTGRKAYDADCSPPDIVEWAVPLIRKGRAAAIMDRFVDRPRNFELLLKLADVAAITLRENPCERPEMSEVVALLEQIVKDVSV